MQEKGHSVRLHIIPVPEPTPMTPAQAMRIALGPGTQFVGPTESILRAVACARPSADSSVETSYCRRREQRPR